MTNPSHDDEERGPLPRDLTKKIITLGLGAYFLTEDTVRRYVKDSKIPRDVGKLITQNATKGKDELYGFIARELSDFLRQMDLQQELDRFLSGHKVRINAEIEFVPTVSQTPGAEDEQPPGEGDLEAPAPAEDGPLVEWNVSVRRPEGSEEGPSEEAAAEGDA